MVSRLNTEVTDKSVYLALHVLGLFSSHICGSLKVQHGLSLLPLILLLVLHLEYIKCNVRSFILIIPIPDYTKTLKENAKGFFDNESTEYKMSEYSEMLLLKLK